MYVCDDVWHVRDVCVCVCSGGVHPEASGSGGTALPAAAFCSENLQEENRRISQERSVSQVGILLKMESSQSVVDCSVSFSMPTLLLGALDKGTGPCYKSKNRNSPSW